MCGVRDSRRSWELTWSLDSLAFTCCGSAGRPSSSGRYPRISLAVLLHSFNCLAPHAELLPVIKQNAVASTRTQVAVKLHASADRRLAQPRETLDRLQATQYSAHGDSPRHAGCASAPADVETFKRLNETLMTER